MVTNRDGYAIKTHFMKLKSIFFASLIALTSLSALAALGSSPDTADATVTRQDGYSVSMVVMVSGTVVREYISPTNTVFGVGWEGPTMPDLRQLLGSSSSQLATIVGVGGRALNMVTGDFVLHSGGHMRFFRGNAYIPSLVPAGVSTDAIN